MTKNEAKALLPILQAYADGKKLQYYNCGEWTDVKDGEDLSLINYPKKYRIKPTPTYRPFVNAEECWEEMQKHQPFGWLKDKEVEHYALIYCLDDDRIVLGIHSDYHFTDVFNLYTFADGTPFGKIVKD